jgi:hypothetical protein
MPTAAETVQKSWIRLLQWIAFARAYPLAYQMMSLGAGVPHPVIDRLLPTLLYVQVVSLFDQALASVIQERKIPRPPKWKPDFTIGSGGSEHACARRPTATPFVAHGAGVWGVGGHGVMGIQVRSYCNSLRRKRIGEP